MKESLKQAGRFSPANAEAAKVLQPAERTLDGPTAPVTAGQYPIKLCISKLKHTYTQLYPWQTYNEVFG